MNSDNIGKFIKSLREEKRLTQEELAKKIHISRQAISRWEKGLSVPNQEVLIKLCEEFNVSFDEIIMGERNPNESPVLKLYAEKLREKYKYNIAIILVIILILLFFVYYFISQYNSVKIYTIYGKGETFEITEGLFIRTNEKLYFNIDNIKFDDNINYDYLEIYYLNNKEEILILKKESFEILIQDYNGYEEYFDYSELDTIINNIYIRVCNEESCDSIKLNLKEDYKNNSFFVKKKEKVSEETVRAEELFEDSKELIEKIEDSFTKNDGTYYHIEKSSDLTEIFYYFPDTDLIILEKSIGNDIKEQCSLDLKYYYYICDDYENEINFSYQNKLECKKGNCTNYQEKINEFNVKLNIVLES